jgi:hypothetical protein
MINPGPELHLVEFHGVIGQVVVDVEVEPGSIIRMVIPVSLEAQDPPILGRWGWGMMGMAISQGFVKAIKIG